jgi:hypothetical protein
MASNPKITDAQYVQAAKRIYHQDGEVEINEAPPAPGVQVSRNRLESSSHGAYVLAWVWVDNDSIKKPRANKRPPSQRAGSD